MVFTNIVVTALIVFGWNSYAYHISKVKGSLSSNNKETITINAGTTYLRVGYIEHITQYANVSTSTAAQWVINANLDIIEPNIRLAAASGVQLLQLSEFALTGLINIVSGETLGYDRMYLYLEQIPTPNQGTASTPCGNLAFSNRPLLQRISCLAKYNSIYLSVNWGDYVSCSIKNDSTCIHGRHQYNTQIVFSSSGEVVAKYWKLHLFNEGEFDTPSTDDPTYFNMSYGSGTVKIGLFTCFDSMYATPSWTLMKNYNISFFLLSHWWVNSGTTSTAVQWFEALSRKYGINLVVASSGWFYYPYGPRDSSGSGIFSQGKILSSYFNYDSVPIDYFGYADVNVSINGPYQKSSVPSYITVTGNTNLSTTYTSLGYATPGKTLSGTSVCSTFTCSFSMKVSSTSTSISPDYWEMFCSDGYYKQADGHGVYYYEQICGAYKSFNITLPLTMTYTKTAFDSFYMTANFDSSALPFILMSQNYQYPYSRIMTTTSYTFTSGSFKLNGSNMAGDEILDIVAQARDFTKDGKK